MMESIKSRLKALENAFRGKPIPTEGEFWEMWKSLDPLSKSLYEALAEAQMWRYENDSHTRQYYETISGYLIKAGLVTKGQSILDLAAELDGER